MLPVRVRHLAMDRRGQTSQTAPVGGRVLIAWLYREDDDRLVAHPTGAK
jgi:hypothetical protein